MTMIILRHLTLLGFKTCGCSIHLHGGDRQMVVLSPESVLPFYKDLELVVNHLVCKTHRQGRSPCTAD